MNHPLGLRLSTLILQLSTASSRLRSAALLLGLTLAAVLLPGCSHYQLGTSAKLSFQSLYVAPVANTAAMPQATAIISTALRDALLRDGRIRLVNTAEAADATLTVDLNQYTRAATSARGDDTGLARKFDLNLQALCTLRDNRSGALLIDRRPLGVTKQIYTTPTPATHASDQQQAEYNTLPLLAQDLANRVTHTILDTW